MVTPPPYPTVRKGLVQDTISTILIGLNTHSTSLAAYSINVYKISLEIVPAANLQYSLFFANSSTKKVVKSWGLVSGHLPDTSTPTES